MHTVQIVCLAGEHLLFRLLGARRIQGVSSKHVLGMNELPSTACISCMGVKCQ